MAAISLETVPKDLRHLRACLLCSLVKVGPGRGQGQGPAQGLLFAGSGPFSARLKPCCPYRSLFPGLATPCPSPITSAPAPALPCAGSISSRPRPHPFCPSRPFSRLFCPGPGPLSRPRPPSRAWTFLVLPPPGLSLRPRPDLPASAPALPRPGLSAAPGRFPSAPTVALNPPSQASLPFPDPVATRLPAGLGLQHPCSFRPSTSSSMMAATTVRRICR